MRVMGLTFPIFSWIASLWECLPGSDSLGKPSWESFPGAPLSLGVPSGSAPWESLPGKASLGELPWKALPGKESFRAGPPR